MEKNVTEISKGLHLDTGATTRPKGTYQYALNAINETDEGELFSLSNEESNEPCGDIKTDYIPIGKAYIGGGKTAIFFTNKDETLSEIGVLDSSCNYTSHVNGELGFKLEHQIDAIYRNRRGCETTLYWVDGRNNKPMYYVLEKPGQFQKSNGDWDKNKFELQRIYNGVPTFDEIKVLDSGGQIEAGSVNIAIQYLDENLNPTEWIITSEVVKIYNDDTSNAFLNIRGSINIESGTDEEDYRDFPATSKSIRVVLGNLDRTFLFYRLAFIEATSGNGQITKIKYTENLPIENNTFVYTGKNFATEGTEEEIIAFNNIVDTASSIMQVDNMVLLADTQGKKVNYCKLQKYASRISADMTVKRIIVNSMTDPANPKSPIAQFEGAGYQPGEIYSFAIVYVFADGTISPAYHIPGKSGSILNAQGANVSEKFVFKPGTNGQKVYPMSITNESQSIRYNDNDNCTDGDLWGVDSVGNTLKGKKVRHHRFPLRSDVGLNLVNVQKSTGGLDTYYQLKLSIQGNLNTPCTQADIDEEECTTLVSVPSFQVTVKYVIDGVEKDLVVGFNPGDFEGSHPFTSISQEKFSSYFLSPTAQIISIEESVPDEAPYQVGVSSGIGSAIYGNLSYTASVVPAVFTSETKLYNTDIFGIQFSNVVLPTIQDTGGEEVVGYYIVRNERTEEEKTILDLGL
jgi:hypothetical protein